MIGSVAGFLRYFEAVHRRAMRDVGALPVAADGWRPATGHGEGAWSINQLVGHMAGSRLYFLSAYRGEGWISPAAPDVSSRERWGPALAASFEAFQAKLEATPDAWLERKVQMIDTPGDGLSGWRVLMMMVEHDIYHRSQIDAYAGLNGWDVPHIYGRSAERIGELQAAQRAKHGQE
ncbi:MAG: DinB family protein [Dehalococcoidia bacterium]